MRRWIAVGKTAHDAEIVRLAFPALGALAADPLVSLVDTAFVGRLGAQPLASLGLATAVFGVAFALFIFLAYGTTPLVAGAVGRGDERLAGRLTAGAVAVGLAIGVAALIVVEAAAVPLLTLVGAARDTLGDAETYLRIRALALPALMVINVGHGAYRGFQDTKTPLFVTVGLNLVNLVLDPILIFGAGMGIAGAAIATVIAQWLGALYFGFLLFSRHRARLQVGFRGLAVRDLRPLAGAGAALIVRTGALLATLALATAVAARIGIVEVAAHQVAVNLWIFLALVVDALAIAGQAMIGRHLAAGDTPLAHLIATRLLYLGLLGGVGLALVLAVAAPFLPRVFTDDAATLAAIGTVYPFVVLMQPINAVVFVWDGLAIGARSFDYLAGSMVVSAAAASAVLLLVRPLGWPLAGVWLGIMVLMLSRALTLARWHARGPLSI